MPCSVSERHLLAACRGDRFSLDDVEIQDVLDLARVHEVWPLVVSTLKNNLNHCGSVNALTVFFRELQAQAVIHQGLSLQELTTVLDRLRGIPTMVLKGPVLAERYYAPGTRVSRDFDIAIHEQDFELARNVLIGLGYHQMPPYEERLQRIRGKDLGFMRTDDDGVTWSVELHWKLAETGATNLNEDSIWARSQAVRLSNTWVRTPSKEDTVMLLALNLRKHRFARLKTVCDLDHLLRNEGRTMDWHSLHTEAHKAGVCVSLRHALELSASLLNTPTHRYPTCDRQSSFQLKALKTLASEDAVLSDGRSSETYNSVAGILPFVSVDKVSTAIKLVGVRLTLSPELASYHVGRKGVYPTRAHYLFATGKRAGRAIRLLAESRRSHPQSGPLMVGVKKPIINSGNHSHGRS